MGWGRTLLLGDIGNRLDIDDVERELVALKRQFAGSSGAQFSQDQKIRRLLEENGELKLYLVALIRLLSRKGVVTPDELRAIVNAVDAEDGRTDGKYSGKMGG